jgi:TonB-linked SusC/RagA family outer membrane protein
MQFMHLMTAIMGVIPDSIRNLSLKQTRKLIRVMKLTAIILLSACLTASATGHTQRVSINMKNAPIQKVFKELVKQTGVSIICNAALLDGAKPVTIRLSNATVEEVIGKCLEGLPLSYTVEGGTIIIKKNEAGHPDRGVIPGPDPESFPPIDIKGKITNESGEPVLASIQVKGTSQGTTTNADGYFELKNVDENATLVISGVSIETKEVRLNGKSELVIAATTKITSLNEVVINKGYYSVRQRENTGDVSRVSSTEIEKQPVSNPLAALQGRVSGLQITQSSGAPGSYFTVRLRGQNSIASGNDPLFIVDGVPLNSTSLSSPYISFPASVSLSPFNSIDPSDIEGIEVLKDADATAIYGSRGANGVILITTKKGKIGKTHVDVSFYKGWGQATRTIDLLNTQQYLQMRHEAFANDGSTSLPANAYDLNGTWDTTRYTNWKKILIGGTANITDAHTSISGGNFNTQFLIGAGYHKETTIFPGDFNEQRGSVNFNVSHKSSNDKLRVSLSGTYSSDYNLLPQKDLTVLIALPPDAPAIYKSDGSLNWQNSTWSNPFAELLKTNKSVTDRLISNLDLSYQIIPSLSLKGSLGYTTAQMTGLSKIPIKSLNPNTAPQSSASLSNNSIKTWIAEPQINYNKKIGEGQLNLLFGATFQGNLQDMRTETGRGFTSDALLENIQAASSISVNGFNHVQYRYDAIFGRINYDWRKKYLVNLTGRRDGSSRFGPGKQFANFGAIGAGWVFSNETFIQQNLKFLSYGKLRGSFGLTGNDQIGDYQYLDTYSAYFLNYLNVVGLTPDRLFNPSYGWESVKKVEAALELGILNDKIFFTASYYRNRTDNQLVGYPLPGTTGFGNIIANLPAKIQNAGVEFELSMVNFQTRNFKWNTAFNLTIPKNKLLEYPNIQNSSYANTYVVGQSLFIAKRYNYTGIDPQTGLYTFEDYDKDNKISSPNDKQFIVFKGQQYYGGLQNDLQYKGWQLGFFIQFIKQKNSSNYLSLFVQPGRISNGLSNQPTYVLNHWQKSGDNSNTERFSNSNSQTSTAFSNLLASNFSYSDASFVRLKNLSLSYQLPTTWKEKLHLSNCRIFTQCQNLITLTRFKGIDPENNGTLPPLKIITAGFELTF